MAKELIVYTCPTGDLARQLDSYFKTVAKQFGPNPAHAYMPHVTLTGFFHDGEASIPSYISWLEQAIKKNESQKPNPALTVSKLVTKETFHGLSIDSEWLKQVTADFAAAADSPTRLDDVRLKDWLHLSMAYGFAPEEHDPLAKLARQKVDPAAQAVWEIRLYERYNNKTDWVIHHAWPI